MDSNDISIAVNEMRRKQGYLGVTEICNLASTGNTILDPWSVLISANVEVGSNNVFYSNVVIQCELGSRCTVGSSNKFYPGSFVLACGGGAVEICDNNEFGDGGFVVKANREGSFVRVGSNGRYLSGAQVMGKSTLGDGTQILGPIVVQDCHLGGGESFNDPDPNLRGAVLKGSGLARGLQVDRGQVVNGTGTFSSELIEPQSNYH